MNAETLRLTALATITRSLMATGAGQVRWSSKVRAFLEDLTTKSLDELMQVSGQLSDGATVGNRVLGYISQSSNGRKRSEAVRPCCEEKS